jgi:hypothetical protein
MTETANMAQFVEKIKDASGKGLTKNAIMMDNVLLVIIAKATNALLKKNGDNCKTT